MTFALSAEEIAFMVKEGNKWGVWPLKPFVICCDMSHDSFQNFSSSQLYVIKQRTLKNWRPKNCPNEWPFWIINSVIKFSSNYIMFGSVCRYYVLVVSGIYSEYSIIYFQWYYAYSWKCSNIGTVFWATVTGSPASIHWLTGYWVVSHSALCCRLTPWCHQRQ